MKINDLFCVSKKDKIKRAGIIAERILPFLENTTDVIDIGCGAGFVASILQKSGKKVTAVDISDKVETKDVKVILYDGEKLPFSDKKFQIALLLTVLHHTPHPEILFAEAARVASQIIIIEDIYNNLGQKLFNVFFDSLQNKPLRFYWHSYKADREWKKFFTENGYKTTASYYQDLPYLHAVYFLQK